MKPAKQLLSYILLAGTLLSVPAIAADLSEQTAADDQSEAASNQVAMRSSSCAPSDDRKSFFESLSMSDAQLEKMAKLKDQFDLNSASKKAELRSLFRQMGDLMTQPTIDRKQITSLQDRMNSLRTDLSNIRLSYALDRAEVFSADQRKQIRHKMLTHQMCGHKHHGFFHHHHRQ